MSFAGQTIILFSMVTEEQLDVLLDELRVLIGKSKLDKALDRANDFFTKGPDHILNQLTVFRLRLKKITDDKFKGVLEGNQESARINKLGFDVLEYLSQPDILKPIQPPQPPAPPTPPSPDDVEKPTKRQLVKVLAKAFRDIDDVGAFADDSNVGSENINMSDGAKQAWRELVTQAENKGRWEDLKDILKDELEGQPKVITMIDLYEPESLF